MGRFGKTMGIFGNTLGNSKTNVDLQNHGKIKIKRNNKTNKTNKFIQIIYTKYEKIGLIPHRSRFRTGQGSAHIDQN